MPFLLASPGFVDGGNIPPAYTCDGSDISPPLTWKDAPKGTRGFALFLDDPDAPGGSFHHWALFDIPASVTHIAQDAAPYPQAVNDFGGQGYGGPCPPPGQGAHHYRFRILALDTDSLGLPEGTAPEAAEKAAQAHALGAAEITGLYARRGGG